MLKKYWSHFPFNPFSLIAALILTVSAFFIWDQFQKVQEQRVAVEKSSRVLLEAELLFSSVKDAEAGLRGYAITRDRDFLNQYYAGRSQIWDHLHQLHRATSGNEQEQNAVKGMEEALQTRVRALDETLKVIAQGNSITSREQEQIRNGRITMENLRSHMALLESEERSVLGEKIREGQEGQRSFNWILILTTALSLLAVIWALEKVWSFQKESQIEAEQKTKEAWISAQVAELSHSFVGSLTVRQVAELSLAQMTKCLPLWAARFYLVQESHLLCLASFGVESSSQSSVSPQWKVGEGLLGQAALREEYFELNDVPGDYFTVRSGLGESSPQILSFLPVSLNGQKLGVIELAAFRSLNQEHQNLLHLFASTISQGLNSAMWRERLQTLLERTQHQAEELQAQQEELKSSNEELEQQAEELQAQQEELKSSNEELESQAKALELQQASLNKANAELKKANDVSQARSAELARANQYKSEFLAKMSHELRTPLNSLLILTTLFIENKEKNLTPQQKEFAQSIYSAGHDLLNLINDILDLSKIEAQKLTLHAEEFSVQNLIEHLERAFKVQFQVRGLEFASKVDPDVENTILVTDQQRVEQVLRNFLSNALKFTEKGQVEIEVKSALNPEGEKKWIEFSVRDSGIGISDEKKDLIFEAFEQADSSISRRFGGTGLGLTISRELAQLLGGTVKLESEQGRGSRFSLLIPQKLPREVQEKNRTDSSPSPETNRNERRPEALDTDLKFQAEAHFAVEKAIQQKHSLLLVESDPEFRATISKVAEENQFSTIPVGSAAEGLEILKQQEPQAVLLDLDLPDMDGRSFLREIKENPKLQNIPVHVISAKEFRREKMGFLGKPVHMDEIQTSLKKIEKLLSQKIKKILLVEDNDRQRSAITHLIAKNDLEIISARTGQDAIKALETHKFDGVILDLELPDISGFSILKEINDFKSSLPPIIVYTGRDITPQEEKELRKYSESIIIKGTRSPERLLDEVNLFLHRIGSEKPRADRALAPAEAIDQAFEGKTALLVDDDLRNVFSMTNVLESWGFNVRIARNGVEALEALESDQRVDVVLMDLMMPKMDGLEAIRKVRQNKLFYKLPIIALTAKAASENRAKCLEAGANDYLPKPVQIGNLRSSLKVWLSGKEVLQ